MSQDNIDDVMLGMFPLVAVPPSGELAKPIHFGTRYLAGKSGMYREVSTPWLHAVQLVAAVNGMDTPYGVVTPSITFGCNMPPASLWHEFLVQARSDLPNECAGAFFWNTTTQKWRFAMRGVIAASHARVDYVEPEYADDEVMVIDVHSHAAFPAGFSRRDDADDRGGIKIAAVFGKVNTAQPDIALRLVCLDQMVPLRLDGESIVVARGAAA